MSDTTNRWPTIQKDPGETLHIELSLFALCANAWKPNKVYANGDYAWPPIVVDEDTGQPTGGAIGYVMKCTQAGRSSYKEPRWTSVGRNPIAFADGSLIWTPVNGSQGITPVIAAEIEDITLVANGSGAPPGISLTNSDVTVIENTVMAVDLIGGTLACDYEVEYAFIIGGKARVGHQLVQVRQI